MPQRCTCVVCQARFPAKASHRHELHVGRSIPFLLFCSATPCPRKHSSDSLRSIICADGRRLVYVGMPSEWRWRFIQQCFAWSIRSTARRMGAHTAAGDSYVSRRDNFYAREKASGNLAGRNGVTPCQANVSPLGLWKGEKTPPPERGVSGTARKGLDTRGWNQQRNRSCVRKGAGCILLAHSRP
jgi:hypothetical protein